MAEAFIKLYSKMLKWEWYDDNNTKILFLHCLLKANWKSGSWHGIDYEPGQFITSLPTLAKETHLTVKQVRVALDHLKRTGEVADLRQGNCRIITVLKWIEYQSEGRPKGKQKADQGQTRGRLGAADKEYKEREEDKELKNNNIGLYFPDDEKLDAAFKDFVDYRKSIKKPMGERAIELNKKDLEKLSNGDSSKAIAIINQSIKRGWQGLFPLKGDDNGYNTARNNITDEEQRNREIDEYLASDEYRNDNRSPFE